MTGLDRPWVLQRYDTSWGGWRDLPRSIEDQDPPRFKNITTGGQFIRRLRPHHPAGTRFALRNSDTGEIYEPRHQRAATGPSGGPTVLQIARGLVIELINWELTAADGASMAAACDLFGAEQVTTALRSIAAALEKEGAAHMTDTDRERLGFH